MTEPLATSQGRGFDDVYASERIGVTRLAFLLVRSQAVAEELAQDAFLRLYEHWDEVENPPGFVREIAEVLGCPTATVRSRTRRALSDLRKELSR